MVSAMIKPELMPGMMSGMTALMSAWNGEQPRSSAASFARMLRILISP